MSSLAPPRPRPPPAGRPPVAAGPGHMRDPAEMRAGPVPAPRASHRALPWAARNTAGSTVLGGATVPKIAEALEAQRPARHEAQGARLAFAQVLDSKLPASGRLVPRGRRGEFWRPALKPRVDVQQSGCLRARKGVRKRGGRAEVQANVERCCLLVVIGVSGWSIRALLEAELLASFEQHVAGSLRKVCRAAQDVRIEACQHAHRARWHAQHRDRHGYQPSVASGVLSRRLETGGGSSQHEAVAPGAVAVELVALTPRRCCWALVDDSCSHRLEVFATKQHNLARPHLRRDHGLLAGVGSHWILDAAQAAHVVSPCELDIGHVEVDVLEEQTVLNIPHTALRFFSSYVALVTQMLR
eukprot:5134868-Prymnesium_polylepis.1